MIQIFRRVVREHASLIDDLIADRAVGVRWRELALLMVVASALYGTVLGWWQGPRLAAYVAVKLPLVLIVTSSFTMLFAWIAARAMGLSLRFAQVGALTFLGLATASVLLASVTPVAWLFTATALPSPSPAAEDARLYRPGMSPISGRIGARDYLAIAGQRTQFTQFGAAVSRDGNLGYTYGRAERTTDGVVDTQYYIRVWRTWPGGDFAVAVDAQTARR